MLVLLQVLVLVRVQWQVLMRVRDSVLVWWV
jgi:hypothetical protein